MPDLSLSLLLRGYDALARDRRARHGGPTYVTRMLGRRCVVLGTEKAASAFYTEELVQRKGAVPPPLAWLLFGRGAVHGLDDRPHRTRKLLFLLHLEPRQVMSCAIDAGRRLADALRHDDGDGVDVHRALVDSYGPAVLRWVGLDIGEAEARRLSRSYAEIVDGFGFAGAAYLRAWRSRLRTDAWARRRLAEVRRGERDAPRDSLVAALAASGLDLRTAAVELGNVIRPTIAVSWLGTFAAVGVGRLGPADLRDGLIAHATVRWSYAQEVRRTAPFVPALAGRARRRAVVDGVAIRPGDRLVLDVRAINFSPDVYEAPERFRPLRFLDHDPGLYALLPQGGGPLTGHRCPGESMSMALLLETIRVVATAEVEADGDLVVDRRRIPTLPRSARLRGRQAVTSAPEGAVAP